MSIHPGSLYMLTFELMISVQKNIPTNEIYYHVEVVYWETNKKTFDKGLRDVLYK